MNFLTAAHTDVGLKKKTNQDSVLVLQAQTDVGQVLLAAICDGMGGLAKGEVASAAMVRALDAWFRGRLPALLSTDLTTDILCLEWNQLVQNTASRIADYGASLRADLGTTAAAFLAVGNTYYIMNVGDSRVYLINDGLFQITKDQTFVQQEVDQGRMTPEQAAVDPQRNVLLQCIGASRIVQPDFFSGTICEGQVYLLCCDGFRHVLHPNEIWQALHPSVLNSSDDIQAALVHLTELNKARREEDNISAIAIRTC